MSQVVKLPDNRFIGVNTGHIKHLAIEQKAGAWAIGTIRSPQE
jgi:hypothetical protein